MSAAATPVASCTHDSLNRQEAQYKCAKCGRFFTLFAYAKGIKINLGTGKPYMPEVHQATRLRPQLPAVPSRVAMGAGSVSQEKKA